MTKVREIRHSRKMKAAELARILKISRAAVCYIEHSGIKHADTAIRYAAALQCRPEELMDFTPCTSSNEQLKTKETGAGKNDGNEQNIRRSS